VSAGEMVRPYEMGRAHEMARIHEMVIPSVLAGA
jgi:hypothetical protein